MPDIDPALRQNLTNAATRVASAFGLTGMASFDFIVAEGTPYLLEVNPRPGASLDVLDDANGDLFRAHAAACLGTPFSVTLVRLRTRPRYGHPARRPRTVNARRDTVARMERRSRRPRDNHPEGRAPRQRLRRCGICG